MTLEKHIQERTKAKDLITPPKKSHKAKPSHGFNRFLLIFLPQEQGQKLS